MAALALLLTTASCTDEQMAGGVSGGESMVTINAQLPKGLLTRAIGDGLTATTLSYAVYAQGTQTPLIESEDEVTFVDGQATLSLRLAAGRSYDFLFWADAYDKDDANAPYAVDFDTQTLSVDYSGMKSNDETHDAFYAHATVEVKGAVNQDITLKRPFAQLNIGTNDLTEAQASGLNTGSLQTSVKVGQIYKNLNLMNGLVGEDTEATFALNAIPDETFTANGQEYDYLALNYLLVATDKSLVNCEFTYNDGQLNRTMTVDNVPVQRNYRTNIFGSLLTGSVDFDITIDPDFEATDHNYAELLLAAQNGGKVTLTEDVTITEPLIIAKGASVSIDLNGHDIINETSIPDTPGSDLGNTTVFQVQDGATLDIRGNGDVKAISNVENEDGYRMAVYALGNSKVNIYGGNFYNNQKYNNGNAQLDLIYADGSSVINIYGGRFESACANNRGYWVLNLKDNSQAAINVYGGTFVNFDPSSSTTENPVKNFVADGYSSVKIDDTPTPNGTYCVVKGTGAASAEDISNALQAGKELITLAADVTLNDPSALTSIKTSTIDLNGQTLTFGTANTLNVPENGNLTFANGEIVANQFDPVATILNAKAGSSITLDNIKLTTTGTGIGPANCVSNVTIIVRNSELNCGAYGVATNASMPVGENVKITLENSKFSASDPVFINIPCEVTIDNCDIDGYTHGMVLRGGKATVSNSTITLTYKDDDYEDISKYFDNRNWGTGNMLNVAALTVGNKSTGSAYQYPSELHLINTTVESAGEHASYFPALYAWANQGEGLGVTITYDGETTFMGQVTYGSDNIQVNGETVSADQQ